MKRTPNVALISIMLAHSFNRCCRLYGMDTPPRRENVTAKVGFTAAVKIGGPFLDESLWW